MRSAYLCVCLLALLAAAPVLSRQGQAPNVVPSEPLAPADERSQFLLPEGFEAQLVAAEPAISKPLNLAFDDQGRLWVTDTLEYPFPAKAGTTPRDCVRILEDFDANGKARKISTFADGLNIPIGLLPLPGATPRDALVFTIPHIQRLRSTQGARTADLRDRRYATYGFADTHGMTSGFTHGFDGWVYACHGFANTSKVKGSEGQPLEMHSGNTYRFRPDGTRLEQYTRGQVNPFGLSLDARGYLYSADCHSEPIYQLIRGATYPSFSKPHDGLGFAPRTITNYRGSTAISGIAVYDADQFPAAYQGAAFVGDVMTNEIVQFDLKWNGTSPTATQRGFLRSKDRWFRPVDVKLGPDGALYVADFYNRIIGHYEVPLTHPGRDRHRGRIWRIVYKGDGKTGTPPPRTDWTSATVPQLISDLGHPNLTVRLLATQQLVHRGGKDAAESAREQFAELPAKTSNAEWRQAHGLWVMERLGALDEPTLERAATKGTGLVRLHAYKVLSERSKMTPGQRSLTVAALQDSDPHVQRAATDALGRHPDTAHLSPLLALHHKVPAADSHLLHTIRVALREQLRVKDTWATLNKTEMTATDARMIAEVAMAVPSGESAGWLLRHIARQKYSTEKLAAFSHHVARHAEKNALTELVAQARGDLSGQLPHQAALFRAVERGLQERGMGLSMDARTWGEGLLDKLLASKHEGEVKLGVELIPVLRSRVGQERAVALAFDSKATESLRLAALQALATTDATQHSPTLGKALHDTGLSMETREKVAGYLGQANRNETRKELLGAMPAAPARLQKAIAATLASSREGGEVLLSAIDSGKASARLLQEQAVMVKLEATKLPGLQERVKKLTTGLPSAQAKLVEILAARRKGFLAIKPDGEAGKIVFDKHCATCHQVSGKGAKIGPQLDGIGLRGLDRVLEDVLDPNRNVDQAFRTTTLTLKSGRQVQGLFLREEGEVLLLADQQGKEVRIAKKDVEERATSPLSPMPANFTDQMTDMEFYHLIGYLLAQRPGAANEKKKE